MLFQIKFFICSHVRSAKTGESFCTASILDLPGKYPIAKQSLNFALHTDFSSGAHGFRLDMSLLRSEIHHYVSMLEKHTYT